ncbi:uncharacterized protein LOC135427724 [Drosophila montana]|uniref:uncharacterized protein LOC135427724 n=1 Tax=Drosophila montana TaxID=40370 RepID=UPI00313B234E
MTRLDKLATGIQLGDGRPTHLLSQLQQTNANNDESVVRRYWIKRLPPAARAVIAGILETSPNTTLSQLATAADAVMDTLSYTSCDNVAVLSRNNTATEHQMDNRISTIEKRLDAQDIMFQKINTKLGQLLNSNNNNGNRRTRSRNRLQTNRSNAQAIAQADSNQNCWYHNKYGCSAQHCIAPCSFNRTNTNNQKN